MMKKMRAILEGRKLEEALREPEPSVHDLPRELVSNQDESTISYVHLQIPPVGDLYSSRLYSEEGGFECVCACAH